MKKTLLITVMSLLCQISFGQKTKEVIIESSSSKEVFSVLKSDKDVKHGIYTLYSLTGKIYEKGQYELGKKTGVWEFYSRDGELDQKYNFTDNKIEWSNPKIPAFNIQTEVNEEFIYVNPDQMPIFIGGEYRFKRYITKLVYPLEAYKNRTQGTVIVSAIITKDGRIIEEKIETGLGSGCDEEALRVIQTIPDEWIPASHSGELRNVKISYPIKFKLAGN